MLLILIAILPVLGSMVYSNASATADLALVIAATVLAFLGAWVASDFLILRRIDALLVAAKKVGQGDLTARAHTLRGLGDWSELAATFNRMATSLQERETDLRNAEKKYRTLVEQISAVTYIMQPDGSGRAIYVSPQIALVLGFSPAEWLADPGIWIRQLYPEDRERVLAEREQSRSSGIPFCSEYRLLTGDGRAVWVRDQSVIVQDDKAQPLFLEGMLFDIDERKRAEEEIRSINAELELRVADRTAEIEATNQALIHEIEQHAKAEESLRQSEARFRLLAENAQDLIYRYRLRPDLCYEYVSPSAVAITGYTPEELYADPQLAAQLVHPDDRAVWDALGRGEGAWESPITLRWRRKDGALIWTEQRNVPTFDETGRLVAIEGIVRDITDRKRAESELQQANANLQSWTTQLEEHNREMVLANEMGDLLQSCLTLQEAYKVIGHSVSKIFPEQIGALYVITASRHLAEAAVTFGEMPPSGLEQVFSPDDCWALRRGRIHIVNDEQAGLLCQHVHESETMPSYICVPMVAQGQLLGVLHLENRLEGGMPEAKQRIGVSIAEHIGLALSSLRLRETLQQQAIHDPLTGLFNRRYMSESLERELRRAGRKKSPVSIIMLDLDHFKHVNDQHGHDVGDAVLRTFGYFLQTHVREEDIVSRYGGEEFALILPDVGIEGARMRAEQLREEITHLMVQHQNHSYGNLSASLGISIFPRHGDRPEQLLRAADSALYQAKAMGRNRVTVAQENSMRPQDNSMPPARRAA